MSWLLGVALLAAGCGSGASPEFDLHGAGVIVRSTAAFTRGPDFPARVEGTVEASLRYWDGSWSDLKGKNLVFVGAKHVACGGTTGAIGCYDGDIRVSTQDGDAELSCVEETVLVHEIGHAVIGDPHHTDPRWMDFAALTQQLQGLPGYDASGDCPIVVNMWRHPPGE